MVAQRVYYVKVKDCLLPYDADDDEDGKEVAEGPPGGGEELLHPPPVGPAFSCSVVALCQECAARCSHLDVCIPRVCFQNVCVQSRRGGQLHGAFLHTPSASGREEEGGGEWLEGGCLKGDGEERSFPPLLPVFPSLQGEVRAEEGGVAPPRLSRYV